MEHFIPVDVFLQKLCTSNGIKFIYYEIVKIYVKSPVEKFLKCENLLMCEIPDWSKYFDIMKRCCKNTYLFNFQYKFLHRVIPTNTFLFKIHIKNTKLCSFYNIDNETVEHLFFDCPKTSHFLKVLFDCLKKFYGTEFSKQHFFLGYSDQSLIFNLLMIIVKNYIYKCKFHNKFFFN